MYQFMIHCAVVYMQLSMHPCRIQEFRAPPCILMIQVHGWMPTSIRVWDALGNEGEEQRRRLRVLGIR